MLPVKVIRESRLTMLTMLTMVRYVGAVGVCDIHDASMCATCVRPTYSRQCARSSTYFIRRAPSAEAMRGRINCSNVWRDSYMCVCVWLCYELRLNYKVYYFSSLVLFSTVHRHPVIGWQMGLNRVPDFEPIHSLPPAEQAILTEPRVFKRLCAHRLFPGGILISHIFFYRRTHRNPAPTCMASAWTRITSSRTRSR